ncbi:MAG TPA: substrate-binding domain-containing protein, partial [Thermohalobaculum sp.]|nr:substrate-binding domain-containing protein [Thermohalobaculum sp.]
MACLAIAALWSTPGVAQIKAPVSLKSKDGSISLTGNLVSASGDIYVLDVAGVGVLEIEADKVDCVGLVCPVAPPKPRGPKFGIYGSRTVGTVLIPTLLEGYAAHVGATYELVTTPEKAERIVRLTNSDGTLLAEIDLQTRGSGSAFPALGEKVADIGMADRRMKDSDVTKLAPMGVPDLRDTANEIVLGLDGISVITNPDNPVRNLSTEDLARIYSGEVTNWLEFGGGNIPIKVNSFGESSGDRAVFLDAMVRPNGRDETASVTRWKDYQDMIDSVIADRGGIGYVGRWLAIANPVRRLEIRESCGLLSPPSDFRMKIEGYTLSRRIYLYRRPGDMHPVAQDFLDWTLTQEAQPFIKKAGFVDRDLERERLEDMGMALIHTAAVEPDFNGAQYKEMMRELRGADRLSISFRFRFGSSTLDVDSVRNLEEFAKRLEAGEFVGNEVLLVGFADAIGDQANNTELAMRRA